MVLSLTDESCCSRASRLNDSSKSYVNIEAPATLHEGYTFLATLEDSSFLVKVPPGGVVCGQMLKIQMPESFSLKGKGQWKDGLLSCFRFGIFHPHLCNAWLCPQILLGQILTRMKMTWLANPTNTKSSFQSTFQKAFILLIIFTLYDSFVAPPMIEFSVDENGVVIFQPRASQNWYQILYIILSVPMTVYGVMVVVKLRAAIRAKYGIPTGRLGKLEDFCCVCCCNCCVISQMARQTADYNDEPASCCSPNGMRHPLMDTSAYDEEKLHSLLPG